MNNLSIQIREGRLEDVPVIVEYNQRMAMETEGKKLGSETVTEGVKQGLLQPEKCRFFVAETQERVVGQAMITYEWSDWRDGLFWWVQSVHVEPEFRRCGVFRSLYAKVKERALSNGCVCGCRLYVEQDNEIAQATYRQLGFKENNYKFFEEMYS